MPKSYSPAFRAAALAYRAAGHSVMETANKFKIHKNLVIVWTHKAKTDPAFAAPDNHAAPAERASPTHHDDAEKTRLVQAWKASGDNARDAAVKLGVPASALYRWSRQYGEALVNPDGPEEYPAPKSNGRAVTLRGIAAEVASPQLMDELRLVREERDVLARAFRILLRG